MIKPHSTNKLTNHFQEIEIPKELDDVVNNAIQTGIKQEGRLIIMKKWIKRFSISAAVIVTGFVTTANLSPTFAKSLSDVPILGSLLEVVTFTQFDYDEETYSVHLEVPAIEGLKNETLQSTLNEKYLEESKKLYEAFEAEVALMKEADQEGHLGIDTGYEIKTDTDEILSIGRYTINTVGSSSTTMIYDTIDKQNELLITLPSLFVDDSYIDIISQNIIVQMKERMAQDENLAYWITGEPDAIDGFSAIDSQQNFYITEEGKLIISFDKYAIAPGYMGIQEFEIPTDILSDILVSTAYLK